MVKQKKMNIMNEPEESPKTLDDSLRTVCHKIKIYYVDGSEIVNS